VPLATKVPRYPQSLGWPACSFYLERPRFFVIFLAIAPVEFFRVRAESRVLEEHFADDDRRYQAALPQKMCAEARLPPGGLTSWDRIVG
jgi:hypothetical protein